MCWPYARYICHLEKRSVFRPILQVERVKLREELQHTETITVIFYRKIYFHLVTKQNSSMVT
jgi:hypothetical protein